MGIASVERTCPERNRRNSYPLLLTLLLILFLAFNLELPRQRFPRRGVVPRPGLDFVVLSSFDFQFAIAAVQLGVGDLLDRSFEDAGIIEPL